MTTVGTPLLWIGFALFVLAMLAIDLGIFHREARAVRPRDAALFSVVWISLALVFNILVYYWFGGERAIEFTTAYLVEEALSVDNVFVFLVIFSAFGVPAELQHRVLFWGILGAMVMRIIFILAGAALLARFEWIFYIFGAFLIYTGVKLYLHRGAEVHPERNPLLRLFRRVVPTVEGFRGTHFLVVENGKRCATPLLAVLVAVEATDIVFAVDSIPAVFGVTRDPFIVYTSNIFAILGLRSLYFVLAGVMSRFRYLDVGLSAVLVFIGAKMLVMDFYKMPALASLVVVALLLGGAVVASLRPAGKPAG